MDVEVVDAGIPKHMNYEELKNSTEGLDIDDIANTLKLK